MFAIGVTGWVLGAVILMQVEGSYKIARRLVATICDKGIGDCACQFNKDECGDILESYGLGNIFEIHDYNLENDHALCGGSEFTPEFAKKCSIFCPNKCMSDEGKPFCPFNSEACLKAEAEIKKQQTKIGICNYLPFGDLLNEDGVDYTEKNAFFPVSSYCGYLCDEHCARYAPKD